MAKVFLGVGHGGSDPGAVAFGRCEKDLNLSIALACNEELLRHGVDVKMSRYKDEEDTLNEECRECNAFAPDLALDIHNNAGGGDGVEAFYHYGGGLSKTLAENIIAAVVAIGQNSRGTKTRRGSDGRDYYGFIRETVAPAVIVECAFVDNATDIQIIDNEEECKTMGIALAKGILATLGIAWIAPVVESPKVETPVVETPSVETPTETPEEIPEETVPETVPENKTEDYHNKLIDTIIKFLEWLMSLFKGGNE